MSRNCRYLIFYRVCLSWLTVVTKLGPVLAWEVFVFPKGIHVGVLGKSSDA